jgi:hypothetical protein
MRTFLAIGLLALPACSYTAQEIHTGDQAHFQQLRQLAAEDLTCAADRLQVTCMAKDAAGFCREAEVTGCDQEGRYTLISAGRHPGSRRHWVRGSP